MKLVGVPCQVTRIGEVHPGTLLAGEFCGCLAQEPEIGDSLRFCIDPSRWVRTSPVEAIAWQSDTLVVKTRRACYRLSYRGVRRDR